MTEIERKALALVNEVYREQGEGERDWAGRSANPVHEALCRAIEQHEAFKLEVSDAVEDYCGYVPPDSPCHPITRFIIAKPDPLGEICREIGLAPYRPDQLRTAIAARGGKIVWEGE